MAAVVVGAFLWSLMSDESDPADTDPTDVMLLVGRTEDRIHGIRARGDEVTLAELRPIAEGKPIVGEIVKLSRRPEASMVYDVEAVFQTGEARDGPVIKARLTGIRCGEDTQGEAR